MDVSERDRTSSLPYRLEAPLGIGKDASRYAARDGAASLVEVRALHAVTREIRTRLLRLARVKHEGLLPILTLHLDGGGPHYVTVHAHTGTWTQSAPKTTAGIVIALTDLGAALAAAHRVGVVHGALEARHVLRSPAGWWLDLSRTDGTVAPPRAPELLGGAPPTSAADVWALGEMFQRALPDAPRDETVDALLAEMVSPDPEARPTAEEIGARLDRTHEAAAPSLKVGGTGIPATLGPYTLLEKLGEGGMGAVFRARAEGDDRDIALKVLLPELGRDKLALSRFRREARVLSQLSTPHIARFIAARRDAQWEYLVMEFVEGRSAHWLLQRRGAFVPAAALAIACDVSHALSEVHALGLVHRDVKPANILIAADSDLAVAPRAKLCDFGIVRLGNAEDDSLTRGGTPGTPSYMAPEQILGREITPAADVYAMGVTLFALLTGKPPFLGDAQVVMFSHLREEAPDLVGLVPGIAPELAAIVKRTLAKEPKDRYPDARALLETLDELRFGAAKGAAALPQPIALVGAPSVYAFTWDLSSTPAELWPHVSNTERLNRAIGLDDVAWARAGAGEDQEVQGSFRAAGVELRWKENPFEWVAPNRLGVVREYASGPFEWMRSTVDIAESKTGTRLTHRVEMKSRGILGRAVASIEVGMRLRRALERTYRRIDQVCVAARVPGGVTEDPFEPPLSISAAEREILHARLSRAAGRGGDSHVLEILEDWILRAPPQAISRIRPYVFAQQLRLPREAVLTAFITAAAEGALATLWDILCPICRIPSQLHATLKALEEHGRCDACDLDFEIDLARSVELVFRVDASIRTPDTGVYCIGGPAHSPHVLAQVRLEKGTRFVLDVALEEGTYEVRGRGLPRAHVFRAVRGAPVGAWSVSLAHGLNAEGLRIVRDGELKIALINDLDRDVLARLERSTERPDVVTAAAVMSNPLFRRLFPHEILSPEELIGASQVTLLCAEVPNAGDRYRNQDDRVVHREVVALQTKVSAAAEAEGGTLVKLHLEGVLAVFADPAAATRAALRLLREMGNTVRASVHTGTAMLTTINERVDYFGRSIHTASELLFDAEPGEVVVSEETQRSDPHSREVLERDAEFIAVVQRYVIGIRYRAFAAPASPVA